MKISERIDNLKYSTKAILMSIIFAVVEFSYTIIFESKSSNFMFYIGLIGVVWLISFIICLIYAEYVEKPQITLLTNTELK